MLNVRDRNGKQIAGLPPSAFRLKVNGQPTEVRSRQIEIASPRVVILLDASGSMTAMKSNWEVARLVAGDLASRGQGLQLALVVFAGSIQTSLDFSHTTGEVFAYIRDLSERENVLARGVDHRTALLDTINHAATIFGSPLPGDSVFVISDGGDNQSTLKQRDIESTLLARGVRFFGFIVPSTPFPTEEERSGPSLMRALAQVTGGTAIDIGDDLTPKGRARIASALRNVYHQIELFYQLELPPGDRERRRHIKIEVVDEMGKRRSDLKLTYPQDVSCGSQPGSR
jgi:Mg-chelatase subunit ChlD